MSIENDLDLSASTLLELDDDVFEQLVLDNIHRRRRDPGIWAALTTPAVIDRTYGALTIAFQRNTRAITTRRDRHQTATAPRWPGTPTAQQRREADEYQYWRVGAVKFSQLVQTALTEVKNIRRRLNADHAEREQHLSAGLRALAHAIDRHQQALADTGTIPEHHDRTLWRMLDQITVPAGQHGRPITVRTMLDIYWT